MTMPAKDRWSRQAIRRLGGSLLLVGVACGSGESTAPTPDPSLRDETGGWQQVVAGDGATCGLDRSGVAYCWGKNDRGQLGDGTNTPHATPARVRGDLRFSMLAMGSVTTCGLTQDGQTYCWGYYGVDHFAEPRLVETSVRFKVLAVGAFSICGLTTEGVVYCWSLIRTGQVPAQLPGSRRFSTLEVSYTSFSGGYCGVATDGFGYCWGEGIQLESEVVRQPARPPVIQIATNGTHTCAIESQGVTVCWGKNAFGELGDGSKVDRAEPVRVRGNLRLAAIGVASRLTCGVGATGGAYCWGDVRNVAGVQSPALQPTIVLPGLLVDRVSVGADHTCFKTPGGAAYCFGANGAGQLGHGVTGDPVEGPVRVLDPS